MAEREALTADYVRSILDYNPETGVFTWRSRPRDHFKTKRAYSIWNARFALKMAGSSDTKYWQILINCHKYRAHRLAWLYMTGEWPKKRIDHRDTDPSNNRWINLREATNSENGSNRPTPSNNTSGYKGVSWRRDMGKWQVQIAKSGKYFHIGYFDEDKLSNAAAAYANAAKDLHGEFAKVA